MSSESTSHGGKREGAGRPAGTYNSLPYGAVKALKAAGLRVPAGASPEVAEVAGYALERMVDVLAGKVSAAKAVTVLKAATVVREELCGPIERKLQVQGAVSINVVNPYSAPPEESAPAPAASL